MFAVPTSFGAKLRALLSAPDQNRTVLPTHQANFAATQAHAVPNPPPQPALVYVPRGIYTQLEQFASMLEIPMDDVLDGVMNRMAMTLGVTMDAIQAARTARHEVFLAERDMLDAEGRLALSQEKHASTTKDAHAWLNDLMGEGHPYETNI
jgi:hypothetical protein